jgi:sulfite reductase (NADPH) hemoprotein beta-component
MKARILNLHTEADDWNEVERNKLAMGLSGSLCEALREERPDIAWEAEQIAKSHGVYLQFNRAKTGKERDWIYMVRLGFPGGGPIAPSQYALLDELAEEWAVSPEGQPSLRLTTRQAVQFHWLGKQGLLEIVRRCASAGMLSLNGCGDNVRNIIACPLHGQGQPFDGGAWAGKLANHFRLPLEPFCQVWAIDPQQAPEPQGPRFSYGPALLNRKFKIAFSAAFLDEWGQPGYENCTEMRTNDLGFAPILDGQGRLAAFQVYVGGGQGEKVGKPTAAMLSQEFACISPEQLLPLASAIVATHQEWGDRQNRHFARLKYVIAEKGVAWFRSQVRERLDFALLAPINHNPGARDLHHGWQNLAKEGWSYGLFVENGRLSGNLKSLLAFLVDKYQTPLRITANQDLLLGGIATEDRSAFERDLADRGYGRRNGIPFSALRRQSGACVGLPTCRLSYTDSEQFETELLNELERRGWGSNATSIGISGCERQCFRPSTKAIGLIGTGSNRYQFRFFGLEDASAQGRPLRIEDRQYLHSVPRQRVADVIEVLFHAYRSSGREEEETFGAFVQGLGETGLLAVLRAAPQLADLLERSYPVTVLT